MAAVVLHRELQALQKLPFCYSCGMPFLPSDSKDRDHVPPKACFAITDRIRPLILPTHKACNGSYKVADERVGQFISLRHGRIPGQGKDRLSIRYLKDPISGQVSAAVDNVDVHAAIKRWVRAFHAALYKEPLDPDAKFGIETPFDVAIPTEQGIVKSAERPQRILFVKLIKNNRAASNVDCLIANNGKLRFECVWSPTNKGLWAAVFALDIYDWKDLGKLNAQPAKGCVGFYLPSASIPPPNACRDRPLHVDTLNSEIFDPFGQ